MSEKNQQELYKMLTAPFPYEDVGIKVQSLSRDKRKGLVVAFIDARSAHDRLDRVFGPMNWWATYTILKTETHGEEKTVTRIVTQCSITARHEGLEVTKTDIGEGEDEKSSFSDSFKRAAVLFGIGRYLYSLPKIYAPVNENGFLLDEEAAKRSLLKGFITEAEPERQEAPAFKTVCSNPLKEKAYQSWVGRLPKPENAKIYEAFVNASCKKLNLFLENELGIQERQDKHNMVKNLIKTVLGREISFESSKEIVADPELRRALNIAIFEETGKVLFD